MVKKAKKKKSVSISPQKPNRRTFGLPLSLHFYNLGDKSFERTFEEWIAAHQKKYNTYEKLFSRKQTFLIYNNRKGVNNWFLNKGEAPVIFSSSKAGRSANTLKDYFISQGYFDVEVDYDTEQLDEKQLSANYNIKTNKRIPDRFYQHLN